MTMPMNLSLQFEKDMMPIVDIVAQGFMDTTKGLINSILISFIHSIKKQQEELKKLHEDIKTDNDILLNSDLDEFYDFMEIGKKNAKNLLQLAENYKEKSDIFMEFYKTTNDLYETLIKIPYEISTIESSLIHDGKLDYAS